MLTITVSQYLKGLDSATGDIPKISDILFSKNLYIKSFPFNCQVLMLLLIINIYDNVGGHFYCKLMTRNFKMALLM